MYRDPLHPPSQDWGIFLDIGAGFVHFGVRIGGRQRLGFLCPPPPPPFPVPGLSSRGFGSWGDGLCPCDLSRWRWGLQLKEIFPDKAPGTPLWPSLGVWAGPLFHGACLKAHLPAGPCRARGLCWEAAVMEAASSTLISLLSTFVKAGDVLPLPESLFEGPEPRCLKWFPEMWVLVQPCGVGSGAGLQAVWGLSGCDMSDTEKWAPVGSPLTSRPSL